MFDTEVINNPKQFNEMRGEWNELLQRSYTNTIFLTWEWINTWWEVFGKGAELFIIAARNGKGELVAIAPLCIRKAKYYKFPVKEMTFIGTGLSDRQDFIISGDAPQVLDEIILKIYKSSGQWDIVHLEQIPGNSFLASSRINGNIRTNQEYSSVCPYVRINGNWEVYFKSLSKKFRKDIRNKTNNMNRLGKWEFKVERDIYDIEQTVEVMAHIETKSRKQDTEKAFLSDKLNRDFLVKFCNVSLENEWIDYSTINMEGIPVAYLFGFLYNNRYYAYNTAYSSDLHDVSPGKLLLNEKIKWCFENNSAVEEFDFLRGDFYIKSLWAPESRKHIRIVFFKKSLYSKLIRYVIFSIRPRIKNFLSFLSKPKKPLSKMKNN